MHLCPSFFLAAILHCYQHLYEKKLVSYLYRLSFIYTLFFVSFGLLFTAGLRPPELSALPHLVLPFLPHRQTHLPPSFLPSFRLPPLPKDRLRTFTLACAI
ncbi:hypothetical protein SOMG_05000 [Schizosaccharomyces osmophilus]|uniref:Uncharacterized protein n=1 Tax=Schizosaccharomyces osmophilus TaxID=2545709 RepID=A0AAF0AY62_9SCHI|nr:uncharacterized protein SOMG_05000 [Schizosaccharomyces osmophilus]WBW74720.1 hypothetical protein SOMG_05000 [Schizosaccharomyces osmophilus]